MKKLCIALAIVCIILLLFGYLWKNGWIYHMVPLSEAKIQEIREAWRDSPHLGDGSLLEWHDERYYGTYNGYIIFVSMGAGLFGETEYFAGEIFRALPYIHRICAYKDGHFMDFRAAYNQGFLDDRDIAKIAEQHEELRIFMKYGRKE